MIESKLSVDVLQHSEGLADFFGDVFRLLLLLAEIAHEVVENAKEVYIGQKEHRRERRMRLASITAVKEAQMKRSRQSRLRRHCQEKVSC